MHAWHVTRHSLSFGDLEPQSRIMYVYVYISVNYCKDHSILFILSYRMAALSVYVCMYMRMYVHTYVCMSPPVSIHAYKSCNPTNHSVSPDQISIG